MPSNFKTRRPYNIARDREIFRLLKTMSPKEVVVSLGLSSTQIIYEAQRLKKQAKKEGRRYAN